MRRLPDAVLAWALLAGVLSLDGREGEQAGDPQHPAAAKLAAWRARTSKSEWEQNTSAFWARRTRSSRDVLQGVTLRVPLSEARAGDIMQGVLDWEGEGDTSTLRDWLVEREFHYSDGVVRGVPCASRAEVCQLIYE